jgi:hypothetical protein
MKPMYYRRIISAGSTWFACAHCNCDLFRTDNPMGMLKHGSNSKCEFADRVVRDPDTFVDDPHNSLLRPQLSKWPAPSGRRGAAR